jgi:excisionase family DNA binding protein
MHIVCPPPQTTPSGIFPVFSENTMDTDTSQDVLYTPLEVAELCKISRRRVYDWIASGWLRGVRVGGRWLVSLDDLGYFRETCRGAENRLMPQLWEWESIWSSRPLDSSAWKPPKNKRSRRKSKPASERNIMAQVS